MDKKLSTFNILILLFLTLLLSATFASIVVFGAYYPNQIYVYFAWGMAIVCLFFVSRMVLVWAEKLRGDLVSSKEMMKEIDEILKEVDPSILKDPSLSNIESFNLGKKRVAERLKNTLK